MTILRIALLGLAVRLVPPAVSCSIIRQWLAEGKKHG